MRDQTREFTKRGVSSIYITGPMKRDEESLTGSIILACVHQSWANTMHAAENGENANYDPLQEKGLFATINQSAVQAREGPNQVFL